MSNQVIFGDEMKPGYRTRQASAAGWGGGGASPPVSPVMPSRSRRVRPHASWRKRGPERRSAWRPERNETKERVRVVKQPSPPKGNSGGFSLNVLFMLFGLMHIAPAGIKGTVIGMISLPLAAFPVLPVVSFVCPIHTYAHAIA